MAKKITKRKRGKKFKHATPKKDSMVQEENPFEKMSNAGR